MSAAVDALADELLDRLADRDDLLDRLAARLADRQPAASDGWLRGAPAIGEYIDAPPSRVYALASAGRVPVYRDGSALVARRSELDQWVRDGGGRRP